MTKFVRSNLSDQIFDYLKEQIVSGEWKPGEKIPSETELSAQLGVSRMSLRTAIKKRIPWESQKQKWEKAPLLRNSTWAPI